MHSKLLNQSLIDLLEDISSFELFISNALDELSQHADSSIARHIASSLCTRWEHIVNCHFAEIFYEMGNLNQEYDYPNLASELEACCISWKTLDFIARRASSKARVISILEKLEAMKSDVEEAKRNLLIISTVNH